MTASLPGYFNFQAFTSAGALAASHRLYTLEPGTSTQKTAYTEPTGTTPHTYTSDGAGGQYIQLDARGELPAPLYLASGSYDVTLKTPLGATVWTRRVAASDSAESALEAALSASGGAGMVGYGASTVEDELDELAVANMPTVQNFGAVGDGVADDTAAIQAAINAVSVTETGKRSLRVNAALGGFYRVTAPLVVSSNFVTIHFDSTYSILRKEFNGEVFQIYGGEVEIHRCAIDGRGATRTGGGVRLMATSANSFRLLNPRIKDTADAPVIIEANAGPLMKIIGGLLQPYGATAAGPVHAVRMAGADTSPANRLFLGMSTGGAPLVDCTGAETMLLVGCDGSKFTTSATSKKVSVTGCRLQSAGENIQIAGIDHCITGNTVASSFELLSGAANCSIRGNVTVGPEVLDGSGGVANSVRVEGATFTPAWTASTTNPTIGNGTLAGRYNKDGKAIDAFVELVIGSTTSAGTGNYAFAMPFQAAAGMAYTGAVWLFRNGVTFRTGTALITSGATTALIYFDGVAGQFGSGTPYALATGDVVRFSIRYLA
jgi:hypothetical protein